LAASTRGGNVDDPPEAKEPEDEGAEKEKRRSLVALLDVLAAARDHEAR
jgi:hypothetical protein